MTDVNFKELESRGFVVIPRFLSSDDVRLFQDDFESQVAVKVGAYRHSAASAQANAVIAQRVEPVLREVAQWTDVRADYPWGAIYFATGRGVSFPWHQDHEAYFSFNNRYHYLNFYVPIAKPAREKSNLCLVPFDVLQRECPASYRRMVCNGASRFYRLGRKYLVIQDDAGSVHLIHRNLDDLAVTPFLDAGDLLLLRGDIIHRTQDTDTERTSLSFRVSDSASPVTRCHLADGSMYKARMLAKNAATSQALFSAFDLVRKDEIVTRELHELMRRVPAEPPRSKRQFYLYLLRQKRRSGVLGRFVTQALLDSVATRMGSLYTRYARTA